MILETNTIVNNRETYKIILNASICKIKNPNRNLLFILGRTIDKKIIPCLQYEKSNKYGGS